MIVYALCFIAFVILFIDPNPVSKDTNLSLFKLSESSIPLWVSLTPLVLFPFAKSIIKDRINLAHKENGIEPSAAKNLFHDFRAFLMGSPHFRASDFGYGTIGYIVFFSALGGLLRAVIFVNLPSIEALFLFFGGITFIWADYSARRALT